MERSCVQIATEYVNAIKSGAEMRELIAPGADGKSLAEYDPGARKCGIQPETLGRMAD